MHALVNPASTDGNPRAAASSNSPAVAREASYNHLTSPPPSAPTRQRNQSHDRTPGPHTRYKTTPLDPHQSQSDVRDPARARHKQPHHTSHTRRSAVARDHTRHSGKPDRLHSVRTRVPTVSPEGVVTSW
ncbi:hypothetical protein HanRHA438_Chr05g0215521 [Helianthus annuus]|uniref:Uncharacterized protein n=1 Tax=Helianthus annuus TaxID=4232 RepID=A0A9K3IYL1_HELAN|nr:hypothetical protein HanXRQr2_Chr05g0205801 [Helianthus annuus]KAJ0918242.1 hypothetical protein HanRHA438_Chr05g0215521 [Helianthus annuus]KAJ0922022.1 hypothetical protein HanPSC8_Chr05g0198641 [Helianthus annuus]